jgi:erythromycin esterase-like protein
MNETLIKAIKRDAIPILERNDFDALTKDIDHVKYVLLGESSHGTSEFYKIRAEITKKLIADKGFTFLAVEGEWPASFTVNRYIKGMDQEHSSAREVLRSFNRGPTWMWCNEEMIDLIEWFKEYNQDRPDDQKVGFYGIDVYSLWESMDEIIHFLVNNNSPDLETAKKAFECFEPHNRQPERYGVAGAFYQEDCYEEVIKLLTDISLNKHKYADSEESSLNLEINALITANAESYYRTMITNDNESWNIRDRHMVEVINRISDIYKDKAKGIIWEHNTHVGDARATEMEDEGIVNVGQLLREQFGNDHLFIVGFGTHRGTVIAADEWGVNFEKMIVPPAQEGSWEDLMHKAGPHDKLLLFNDHNRLLYSGKIGHRAIGVIYNPKYEHYGNYVKSVMSKRYDAFIYVNSTNALTPMEAEIVYF